VFYGHVECCRVFTNETTEYFLNEERKLCERRRRQRDFCLPFCYTRKLKNLRAAEFYSNSQKVMERLSCMYQFRLLILIGYTQTVCTKKFKKFTVFLLLPFLWSYSSSLKALCDDVSVFFFTFDLRDRSKKMERRNNESTEEFSARSFFVCEKIQSRLLSTAANNINIQKQFWPVFHIRLIYTTRKKTKGSEVCLIEINNFMLAHHFFTVMRGRESIRATFPQNLGTWDEME